MQIRNIILAASAVAVLGGFGFLLVASQGDAKPEVDDKELEDALARYKRSERRSSSSASEPPTPRTPRIPSARRKTESKSEDDAPTRRSVDTSGSRTPAFVERENEVSEKMDLQSRMNDANGLYDRADYEGAREAALEILENNPDNVRMLRIVVSSSCIMAEPDEATKYYNDLPARDQRQMARRCKRYGVEFEENQ